MYTPDIEAKPSQDLKNIKMKSTATLLDKAREELQRSRMIQNNSRQG
jgi:hypothetical protein